MQSFPKKCIAFDKCGKIVVRYITDHICARYDSADMVGTPRSFNYQELAP